MSEEKTTAEPPAPQEKESDPAPPAPPSNTPEEHDPLPAEQGDSPESEPEPDPELEEQDEQEEHDVPSGDPDEQAADDALYQQMLGRIKERFVDPQIKAHMAAVNERLQYYQDRLARQNPQSFFNRGFQYARQYTPQ